MRVLLFEPRTEGHHLPWTGMMATAILDQGLEVILAHGSDPAQKSRLTESFPELNGRLQWRPIQTDGHFDGGSALAALDHANRALKPDRVLVANLDEFASGLFRSAAVLGNLPTSLQGRLRGIYIRPRPLDPSQGGMGNRLKRWGYRRLCVGNAFAGLGILDEFLIDTLRRDHTGPPLTWIPDFWHPLPAVDRKEARAGFNVPDDRTALLMAGVPHRRKGLELAVQAMSHTGNDSAMLLIAGRQIPETRDMPELRALIEAGRAVVHDRHLTDRELAMAFAACDRVLLPYRSHYGSSGILSTAAAAGKPVIASNFHLIGRRVVEHGLGLTHANEDYRSLAQAIDASVDAADDTLETWRQGLHEWQRRTRPEAFSNAVLELLDA